MLQTTDRLERIRTLMEQRAPFYAQADIVLDTSSLSIDEVVTILVDRLQQISYGFTDFTDLKLNYGEIRVIRGIAFLRRITRKSLRLWSPARSCRMPIIA